MRKLPQAAGCYGHHHDHPRSNRSAINGRRRTYLHLGVLGVVPGRAAVGQAGPRPLRLKVRLGAVVDAPLHGHAPPDLGPGRPRLHRHVVQPKGQKGRGALRPARAPPQRLGHRRACGRCQGPALRPGCRAHLFPRGGAGKERVAQAAVVGHVRRIGLLLRHGEPERLQQVRLDARLPRVAPRRGQPAPLVQQRGRQVLQRRRPLALQRGDVRWPPRRGDRWAPGEHHVLQHRRWRLRGGCGAASQHGRRRPRGGRCPAAARGWRVSQRIPAERLLLRSARFMIMVMPEAARGCATETLRRGAVRPVRTQKLCRRL